MRQPQTERRASSGHASAIARGVPGAARAATSIVLILLAALLAIGANSAWWATRVIFDTDTFVSTTESTIRQPEVQTALANRIADVVVTQGDIQARLTERLPQGLEPLAGPLAEAERGLIQRAALLLLQSPRFQAVMDRAIRLAHDHIVAVLENDGTVIRTEGTSIVLDISDLLDNVQGDLSSRGQSGLLSQVSLPPDAGRIVLIDHAGGLRAASFVAQHRQMIVISLFIAAIALGALSVLAARDHRAGLRRAGIALAVAGALSIVALAAARSAVVPFARDETAARAAFNEFTVMLRWQSLGMMVVGLAVAGVAVALGQSHAAQAIRGWRTHRSDIDAAAELRAATRPLILGAILVTMLVLLAWPQPSPRVYGAAFLVVAAYIGVILLLSSSAEWAVAGRERVSGVWNHRPDEPRDAGPLRKFVWREERQLELIGITLALMAFLFWPGTPTLGRLVVTLAALVVYVGSIEWASNPSTS